MPMQRTVALVTGTSRGPGRVITPERRAPTRYDKTGVVFQASMDGFQDRFILPGGGQAMRPLPCFTGVFRQANGCGRLRDPDLAVQRMKSLLALWGVQGA